MKTIVPHILNYKNKFCSYFNNAFCNYHQTCYDGSLDQYLPPYTINGDTYMVIWLFLTIFVRTNVPIFPQIIARY